MFPRRKKVPIMKNLLYLTLALLLSLSSCAVNVNEKKAEVISDCTGLYLRLDEGDYLVCNQELLRDKVGKEVSVTFEKTDQCPEFKDKVVCMMYHENLGLVRVTSVR